MASNLTILVVALPAEAKPVNRRYGLRRDNRHGRFSLYQGRQMALVVSGPGKKAALQAADWMHSILNPQSDCTWVNLGIAGHATRPVGQMVYAELVEDATTGDRWETSPPPGFCCEKDKITTLESPDTEYSQEGLVDMEAAGFFRAARRYVAPEHIHCIKVVSDNRSSGTKGISGKMVSRLIGHQLDILDGLLERAKEVP
jgi:nucleoside phosphorylase